MTLVPTDGLGSQHWPFVIWTGETEAQRQRREWPEVPQEVQKRPEVGAQGFNLLHNIRVKAPSSWGLKAYMELWLQRNWASRIQRNQA